MNEDAPEGKELKYARIEWERRFLLATRPALESSRVTHIFDRYIRGTRIRLRRSVEVGAGDERVFHKFTQKVPDPGGGPGLLTTMYLSAAEYEALAKLPADELSKVRHSISPLGVDEFTGGLAGLWLAEAEFDSNEAYDAFGPPEYVMAEVTGDIRFTGGRLATADRSEVAKAVADYGVSGLGPIGGSV